jgi:starch synthase (maltosyl-transferring)
MADEAKTRRAGAKGPGGEGGKATTAVQKTMSTGSKTGSKGQATTGDSGGKAMAARQGTGGVKTTAAGRASGAAAAAKAPVARKAKAPASGDAAAHGAARVPQSGPTERIPAKPEASERVTAERETTAETTAQTPAVRNDADNRASEVQGASHAASTAAPVSAGSETCETSATSTTSTAFAGTAGPVRAVIDRVMPEVDGGRFAVKRVTGEPLVVEADCFTDGHDAIRVMLRWRVEDDAQWQEVEMTPLVNDRWQAEIRAGEPGRYRYTVCAWVDHFATWRKEFARREDVADLLVAARVGAALIAEMAERAQGSDREALEQWASALEEAGRGGLQDAELSPAQAADVAALRELALDLRLGEIALRYPDRQHETVWPVELPLRVDRERARFSSWYELFPRSTSPEPGRHGTLADCTARLDYVAELGFDVVYLPPIHPIGRERRKGRNNAVAGGPDDVGSPWAIGAEEGGHKSVHPDLGTLEDFRGLVAKAQSLGMEIALDIAFQCAPDHPYVKEHPQWFRWRPDGTVQYAENPPKKYQDIYPFDFETEDWQALWQELKSVFEFWIEQGVRIFRVDNPHTKPFGFWEWVIDEINRSHPDVIFLAEAFTRPKVMHRLAKLGYTQSYTYFAWRNTRHELTEYFTELSQGPGCEYFRPNAWPNTPDILTEALQYGGRPVFASRLVLAATLAASYGIYGPAYELMEHTARDPGTEEYLDSEKYQIRHWQLDRPDSLRPLVALINRIRHENPALHSDRSLMFFPTDNEQLICYAKRSEDGTNTIVVVVNLDPHNVHSGWVDLDLEKLELEVDAPYQMHDLLSGARYLWQGSRNFVQLDPARMPAHVFRLRRRVSREQDFDYFL